MAHGSSGVEGIHRGKNLETDDYEFGASVELLYPDGDARWEGFDGFQVDAGVRIQGNSGRYDEGRDDHKQSFSLKFRTQYAARQRLRVGAAERRQGRVSSRAATTSWLEAHTVTRGVHPSNSHATCGERRETRRAGDGCSLDHALTRVFWRPRTHFFKEDGGGRGPSNVGRVAMSGDFTDRRRADVPHYIDQATPDVQRRRLPAVLRRMLPTQGPRRFSYWPWDVTGRRRHFGRGQAPAADGGDGPDAVARRPVAPPGTDVWRRRTPTSRPQPLRTRSRAAAPSAPPRRARRGPCVVPLGEVGTRTTAAGARDDRREPWWSPPPVATFAIASAAATCPPS